MTTNTRYPKSPRHMDTARAYHPGKYKEALRLKNWPKHTSLAARLLDWTGFSLPAYGDDMTIEAQNNNISLDVHVHYDDQQEHDWLGEIYSRTSDIPYKHLDYAVRYRPRYHFQGETVYIVPMPGCEDPDKFYKDMRKYYSRLGMSKHQAHNATLANLYMDVKRLQELLDAHWYSIGISVTLNVQGYEVANDSLWGIESDAGNDHLREVVQELADNCFHMLKDQADKLRSASQTVNQLVKE